MTNSITYVVRYIQHGNRFHKVVASKQSLHAIRRHQNRKLDNTGWVEEVETLRWFMESNGIAIGEKPCHCDGTITDPADVVCPRHGYTGK